MMQSENLRQRAAVLGLQVFSKRSAIRLGIVTQIWLDVPWIPMNNDGVVTIKSQECIDAMQKVELYTNHYEVLIHPDTVRILQEYFEGLGLDIF